MDGHQSDCDTAPPQVAREVPPVYGAWDAFVRGWRPFAGWICGLVLLARGVIVPLTQLIQGKPVDPADWVAFTAFVAVLGLGHLRTRERIAGVAG